MEIQQTIGFVRRGFSSTGGAESYLRRFAEALVQKGDRCALFTTDEWPAVEWPYGKHIVLPGRSPLQFAEALKKAAPKKECDFLFSLERVLGCDCYRAGDGVHRSWLERRARYEPKWKSWYRKFQSKHRELLQLEKALFDPQNTGVVIANSQLVKEEIVRYFAYPEDRIEVIYNGISPALIGFVEESRTKVRREFGIGERDYIVLFAGSGWGRKGLRYAIEAMSKIQSQATLWIAGRGNARAFKNVKNVKFLGPVSDMKSYLSAADVFLLPTIYDPFSNACLEAMATGLPVITTSSNGFSEIIENGREGSVIKEPSDVHAIAAAIDQWSDPDKRNDVRSRLLMRACDYDIAKNLHATLRLFAKA